MSASQGAEEKLSEFILFPILNIRDVGKMKSGINSMNSLNCCPQLTLTSSRLLSLTINKGSLCNKS